MAFNQSSFFLYPPRHFPQFENPQDARTFSGEPLEIAGSELPDESAPRILNTEVHARFRERGFCEEKQSSTGVVRIYRDRERTFLGEQGVIETSLMLDEEELEVLYIRFLLTRDTPQRLPGWRDLINELGETFHLRIMDPEDFSLRPCADFYTLLLQDPNFIDLRASFKWQLDD